MQNAIPNITILKKRITEQQEMMSMPNDRPMR